MKKKVTLSIEDKVYDKFQKFCIEKGFMLSRIVELGMIKKMEKEVKDED